MPFVPDLSDRLVQVGFPAALAEELQTAIQGSVSGAWKIVGRPGSETPAELNAYMVALSANGGGSLLFPPSATPYVFDDELLMSSNTSIILSPGVVLTRPDAFTLTCTTTSGSKNVTVTSGNTDRLRTGQFSAQIVAGAGVPINTSVETVTSKTTFTLENAATSSGAVSLTFHWGHNVIRRQSVSNTRIIAPWGRATIDGNGLNGPITGSQADYVRNCISTAYCTDAETSGLLLTRAFFHGEIGVNNCGKINLEDIQGYQNGYRAVHYHGYSPGFSVNDLTADRIESLEDGVIGFQVSGNDWNSGIFICFDNCRRYQVGRLRARRMGGLGVHLNGNVVGGVRSSQINYDSIVVEDCFLGVGLFNGLRHLNINSIQAKGTITQFAGVTLGNTESQLPRYNSSGVFIPGAIMMPMVMPGGTDMTQFYRGMVVLLQDVAAIRNSARRVWSVDAASRTLMVFADNNGASRPWDISLDTTTTSVTFGTMRQGLFLSTASDSSQQMQDVSIGAFQAEGVAGRPIACNAFGAGVYAAENFRFGSIHQRDCIDGSLLASVQSPYVGAFFSRNVADRRTGNDTANVDLVFNRCDSVHVGKFDARSTGTGSTTRTNAALLQFPNGTTNVKMLDVVAQNGNGSAFAVDWTGCTNIMLGDPRNAAGTALAPSGAATNGSAFKYGMA